MNVRKKKVTLSYESRGGNVRKIISKLSKSVPIEERLGLKDDMRILDVGCGKGRHLDSLGASNILRVGLDISRTKTGLCKSVSIEFILGDACYLCFREQSFDIVMSRQFVSHVWNLDKAIEEMKRVSKLKIYLEDSNVLNPIVFLELIQILGISWLWKKGRFHRLSKLEDVHSMFWWRRKYKNQIKVLSRRDFENSLLNFLWKFFGPDCIFCLNKMSSKMKVEEEQIVSKLKLKRRRKKK